MNNDPVKQGGFVMKHAHSVIYVIVLVVSFLFISAQAHAALDLKGLVGLWLLDDGKGDVAKDSSTNKNDGKLDAGAKWENKGKFSGGLVTTAQNGINVPVSDSLNTVVDAISIGGWFRIDTDSDTGLRRDSAYLLEDQSTSEATPDAWAFTIWSGGTYTLVWGTIKVKKGEWTHIVGTYDGKIESLYINGELDTTANKTGKIDTPANALGLGKYSSETYIGGMDELFLFNRALSQNEIKDLMKGYKSALAVESNESKLTTVWGNIKVSN